MTVGGGQRKTLSACVAPALIGQQPPSTRPIPAADDSWAAGTIRPAVCIGQGSWGVRVLFSITHRDGLFRIRITPRSAASSRATHIDRPRDKQTHFSKSQTKYQRLLDGEGPSKNYLAESESWTLAFENLHDGNKRKSL
ncbi:predicted protein [Histoplasma capsulatum var. duboisii H88]|uniref:Predicted protein n=1 Tax=Ajellomyces capsulatus (strain H88) TaxID=544711 RepID=F0UNJ4_AJEC8|nr:predicted protein [Histoplasma capsulatum var. duboisii H88]